MCNCYVQPDQGGTFDIVKCAECLGLKADRDAMVERLKRHSEERDHYRDEVQRLNLQVRAKEVEIKRIIDAGLDKLDEANRLNRDLQQLFSEVATMFELTSRQDIDGLLRARIQEALGGVAVKRFHGCTKCGAAEPPCLCRELGTQ